jgi:hypothetical protein
MLVNQYSISPKNHVKPGATVEKSRRSQATKQQQLMSGLCLRARRAARSGLITKQQCAGLEAIICGPDSMLGGVLS